MNALELKIPPPVVLLILGAGMWLLSLVTPELAVRGPITTTIAVVIALVGVGFSVAADVVFHRAKTTMNPLKPENASSLVTGGVYQITRNPMYVGGLCVLVAWAVFLANPWALLGPAIFVPYITRFQIIPEERVLSSRFGESYATYRTRVRRWL